MEIIKEFKAFITKGNVIDLAVGVIIGGAFGKVVDSVVKDLIMPLIALIGGQPNFSHVAIGAREVTKKVMENGVEKTVTAMEGGIMVGNFLNTIISFLIIAAVIFFVFVKPMNRFMSAIRRGVEPPPTPPPTPELLLLAEIRDLLKNRPDASVQEVLQKPG